jgi:hypothetical protein
MRNPTPDDLAAAQSLLASVHEWAAAGGLSAGYQHDHDEELGRYWYEAHWNRPNLLRDRYQAQDRCAPSTPPAPSRSSTLEDAREVIRLTQELQRVDAARKLGQCAGRKVIHREGRSFYADLMRRQYNGPFLSSFLRDSAGRREPARAHRIGEAGRGEWEPAVTTAHVEDSWPRRFRIR